MKTILISLCIWGVKIIFLSDIRACTCLPFANNMIEGIRVIHNTPIYNQNQAIVIAKILQKNIQQNGVFYDQLEVIKNITPSYLQAVVNDTFRLQTTNLPTNCYTSTITPLMSNGDTILLQMVSLLTFGSNPNVFGHTSCMIVTEGVKNGMVLNFPTPIRYEDYMDSINTILYGNIAIKKPAENTAWQVYPNPAQENIFIQTEDYPAILEIYDAMGRKISQHTIVNKTTTIPLENYPIGVYFYHAIWDNRQRFSGRFVKQE